MRFGRRALLLIAIAIVTIAPLLIPTGGLTTATDSTPSASARAAALLSKMTLDEKLQQLQLLADWQITDAEASAGVGAVFSLTDAAKINHLQHIAVEQSRLHIPILSAYDT